MSRRPSKLKPAQSRKPDHGPLPSCLRAGSSNTAGPGIKDEPHASLGETQAWGSVAAPQNGGNAETPSPP